MGLIVPQNPGHNDQRGLTVKRIGALAGMFGAIIFVAIFVIEGWLRPSYDSMSMFVSALSLGSRGWIQVLNFEIVGVALLAFSRGVAAEFKDGMASRAGPLLLAIVGLGLLLSGPFVMDPVTTPFVHMSWHSKLHYLFGAFVFSFGPISCFVFFRRFRTDSNWRSLKQVTLLSGIIMTVSVVLLKVAELPNILHDWTGLIQRVFLISYLAWIANFAFALLKRIRLPR